ncbi:MAG TPA: helix-turn-helix transcriptional regulator [Pseudonocardiaceae bacterium]|nr:helix-turn-helix transcriptional regulator [Pseudonocardiaceae bacterium]
MPIGERIAIYRRRRGLTQLVLAGLIGRSESWLSQVERGIRPVDRLSVLIDISHILKIDVTDLTGQPFSLAPNGSLENEAVRAIGQALTRYDAIPAILDPGRDAPLPGLASLRRDLRRAWQLRQAARYSELGAVLPRLIADTEATTREFEGTDRLAAFAVLAETYHVTAMALKKFGENELAWIAADRGVLAAERAEAPLLMAVSARAVGQVFMSAGRLDEAERVSTAALTALEPGLGKESPEYLSVWGALLWTRAIIAARKNDRSTAGQFLHEAAATAGRLGQDRNDFWTAFGPTNVAIHAVSVDVELGDPAAGLCRAPSVDPSRLSPELVERRVYHMIDLARGYAHQRNDAAAVLTLLEAERVAPEEVRYHVIVPEMLRDLLRRERRAATPGLRPLAARVGVLS